MTWDEFETGWAHRIATTKERAAVALFAHAADVLPDVAAELRAAHGDPHHMPARQLGPALDWVRSRLKGGSDDR